MEAERRHAVFQRRNCSARQETSTSSAITNSRTGRSIRQYNTCYENTAGTPQLTVPIVQTAAQIQHHHGLRLAHRPTLPSNHGWPSHRRPTATFSISASNFIRWSTCRSSSSSPFVKGSTSRSAVNSSTSSTRLIWGGPGTTLVRSNAGSSSSSYSTTNPTGYFVQANDRAYRSTHRTHQLLTCDPYPRGIICAGASLSADAFTGLRLAVGLRTGLQMANMR